MPQYEMTGTVKHVLPVQTFPSGFAKRELVVTSEDERFPQDIAFEFLKEKMDLLNEIQEADRVTVHFDLRGREYNGRYFLSANGWRIEKAEGTAAPSDPASTPSALDPAAGEDPDDLGDSMPF